LLSFFMTRTKKYVHKSRANNNKPPCSPMPRLESRA
jgi:hypothetical protein